MGGVVLVAIIGAAGFFLNKRYIRKRRERSKKDIKAELGNDGERKPELDGKDGAHEMDSKAQGYYGAEVEGKRLPGHEIDGQMSPGHELEGGFSPAAELSARETPAAELP